jgi:hypothetical protein
MKNHLAIFNVIILLSLFLIGCGAKNSVTFDTIFQKDLDADLEANFQVYQKKAFDWQADARLNKVRLNINEKGEIAWRFHWFSNSTKKYLALFSSAPSFRLTGDAPDAEQQTDLKITNYIGFNKVAQILQKEGVDLKAIKEEDVMGFKLDYFKWKDPKDYYYYIFLKNGTQYYIHARTGLIKK